MKVLVQRVLSASVAVDSKIVGSIQKGALLFVGFTITDTRKDLEWFSNKVIGLRIFEDQDGKMNISIKDAKAELLVVPQFTLYGNCKRGFRPDFTDALEPNKAKILFDEFYGLLKASGLKIEAGIFQADMKVALVNDGPVTLIIE